MESQVYTPFYSWGCEKYKEKEQICLQINKDMLFYVTKELVFTFYKEILKEYSIVEDKIKEKEALLNTLPEGKLICARNGNRYKWYNSNGHISSYISKSERSYAEQLAYKKFLIYELDELYNEKKALEAYISKYNIELKDKAEELFTIPGYNDLLSSRFKSFSKEVTEWCNAPYNKNSKYPEHLVYKTISGKYVRSKSEELIDMALYMNHIPFRYECELVLGGNIIYPDFTIMHPENGKIYYWEHFGMMDDETYANNACSKIRLYISNGIIPSMELITTYETKNNPLSSENVNEIINKIFY